MAGGAGGAGGAGDAGGGDPAWYTPARMQVLFMLGSIMLYIDRGAVASNGVMGEPGGGVMGAFDLNDAQYAVVHPFAFLVGLLVASPIFSHAVQRVNPFRILSGGLAVFMAALLASSAAPSYGFLVLCRTLVGVGEGAFVCVAPPFIDDRAPPQRKTLWLGLYYMCIPAGVAFGYVYGGVVGPAVGWRYTFLIQAAAIAPLVAFFCLAPPIRMRKVGDEVAAQGGSGVHLSVRDEFRAFAADVKAVFTSRGFGAVAVGFSAYTWVSGVLAAQGPRAGFSIFQHVSPFSLAHPMVQTQADIMVGAVTVVTGILSCVIGGLLLDRLGARAAPATLVTACGMCAAGLLAVPTFLATNDFIAFGALLFVVELFLFLPQGPLNALVMWIVPPRLRSLACSLITVTIHLCGDVPGPIITGVIEDALESRYPDADGATWRWVICGNMLLLVPGALAFVVASRILKEPKADTEEKDSSEEKGERMPLL